jgi:hypothetical protein
MPFNMLIINTFLKGVQSFLRMWESMPNLTDACLRGNDSMMKNQNVMISL